MLNINVHANICAQFYSVYTRTVAPAAIVSEMPFPILLSTYKQICFISFCDIRLMAQNSPLSPSLSVYFYCESAAFFYLNVFIENNLIPQRQHVLGRRA